MALKILFPPKLSFSHFIVILLLFFSTISIHAQCAGNDKAITVCDIPNPSNQSIDLFSLLGGGAVVGGTWTDDLLSGGLNLATGILNAQIIKNSGIYTYTYTSNMGCGDNSSTITVTIGGYSGVPSSTAKACSDDASFNLFQVFNGTALRPQFNGIWSDDDGTGALNGNFLNAAIAGLGTHTFTYTMPGVGTCPSQSSTVKVTVARAPEPGTPAPLLLCNTDLASYTNLDLNSRLTGADPGGIWTESGTSELSGIFDSTINVQNIYNTLGPGKYSFTYSVFPDDPVCNIKEATVDIIIEKQLDFTGAIFNVTNNVCQNKPVVVSISGLGAFTNITLKYNLTGVNTAINETATLAVSSGNANFSIPEGSLVNTGTTTLVITALINNVGSGCGFSIPNGTKSFTINAVPAVPSATGGTFCKSDNKTIADLSPSGIQYQWFDSLTSTTVLSASTPLVSGNYYVKEVNATTGCESGRAMANVIINDVQAPTLNQDGQNFCALDNPILQNLTDNVIANGNLHWFDAPTNGTELGSTALLKDGFTYYGFDYSSATGCYSSALAVTVSLSHCDETPGFFIPDGFSPNGDTVNDSFRIPDIEFIYPNYSLEIYNRYGNLMFTGNIDRPEWDGKSSDANIAIDGFAPNGVYFYVIKYNKGNKSPKQGRLYLNR